MNTILYFVGLLTKNVEILKLVGKKSVLKAIVDFIEEISDIFGLQFLKEETLSKEEEKMLEDRVKASRNKDFKRSDELRDLLKAKGIVVEDTPKGQKWRRA